MIPILLAITIMVKIWHILAIITIVTLIIAVIMDASQEGGMYSPTMPVCIPIWFVLNLIIWLIYFIIV